MGLFQKFKEGLQKTRNKLAHEIKRIITASPKLTPEMVEELENALIGADLGTAVTGRIIQAVKTDFETQGRSGLDVFAIARRELESMLGNHAPGLARQPQGLTVVSIVGVNGTGKTTTAAKLAHLAQARGESSVLAACDTFRAAAVEQLKLWGERLNVPVIVQTAHGGIDTVVEMHNTILGIFREKNPKIRGAISTWFMTKKSCPGFEGADKLAAHAKLDLEPPVAPRIVGGRERCRERRAVVC